MFLVKEKADGSSKIYVYRKSPALLGSAEEGYTIALQTVYSDNPENAEFFKWTPFGQLRMGTVNLAAAAEFEVGKEYYIDFTKAN